MDPITHGLTDVGQTLHYFAPYLYLKTTKQGNHYRVDLSDLRYNYKGFSLGAAFVVDKSNRVVSQDFKSI